MQIEETGNMLNLLAFIVNNFDFDYTDFIYRYKNLL